MRFVADGHSTAMEAKTPEQQLAMLHILYGASSAALTAFRAADQLLLDAMVTRTHGEIGRLSALLASGSAV
jgi:hypothetical protein